MKVFQPAVIERWVARLTDDPSEGGHGLDDGTAESVVSRVTGNPRLRSADINSETDIEAAREVASEVLSGFDPSSADIPAERWERVRGELVDILGHELRRSYWDERAPTVTSAAELRLIVENARLADRDIAEAVSDGLDGFYVGEGDAPEHARTTAGEARTEDEGDGEEILVEEGPDPGHDLAPGGADPAQVGGMLNYPGHAEYQPEDADADEDDRDDEPGTADDGDGAEGDVTEDE